MFTMKNYVQAASLQEAYQLRKTNKQNIILGGNLWLKMGNRQVQTGIDLCNLSLDTIEEDTEEFRIGCMCSLRDLETNDSLNVAFNGSIKEALRHIVGVQFRNTATVGGSVFPRFGFSDVLTVLSALDTYIELYNGGIVPIKEFLNQLPDDDILVRVIIKKDNRKVSYQTIRQTETDFGILNCAISKVEDSYTIVLGATPHKAKIVKTTAFSEEMSEEDKDAKINQLLEEFRFGSNMRGSAEYREAMAKVLIKRALAELA